MGMRQILVLAAFALVWETVDAKNVYHCRSGAGFDKFTVAVPNYSNTELPRGPSSIEDLGFRRVSVGIGWIEESTGQPNTFYVTRPARRGYWLTGFFVRGDIPYVLVINTDDGPPHAFELHDPLVARGKIQGFCE